MDLNGIMDSAVIVVLCTIFCGQFDTNVTMVVWNQSGNAISDIVLYTTSVKLGWSFVLFTVLWSIHALLVTLSINSVTAGQSGI